MNLAKKSEDLRRRITWRNKSLMNCSKDELIECILNLSSELVRLQNKSKSVSNPVNDATIGERQNAE